MKKEYNENLNETQRSAVGPKTDTIVHSKPFDVNTALVEVSVPYLKVGKVHLLDDRIKLANARKTCRGIFISRHW